MTKTKSLSKKTNKPNHDTKKPTPISKKHIRFQKRTNSKNNNINTLIVEGGGITLDYFFEQGWVDEIHVYIADCQTNSVDAIRQAAFIQDKHQFTMKETQQLGPDTFIRARIIQTGDT